MAFSIDVHPERQKIIDAILAGKTMRDIARSVTPNVSAMAVQRYRAKVIVPTLKTASELAFTMRANGLQLENGELTEVGKTAVAVTSAQLAADPFLARVEKLRQDREKVKSMAIDGDKPDLRAWASLDKNDLTELELHARLCNRLTEQSGPSIAIQIVCPAGSQPEVRQAEGGVVVDITPGR